MSHVLDSLDRRVWITRGARFRAYKRLKFKELYSTFIINALSAYLAAIGILALNKSFHRPESADAIIAALSLILLTVSFLESSQNYKSRADAFHKHALDLSNIYNDIQNKINFNIQCSYLDVVRITNSYQALINNFPENHAEVDLEMFNSDNWRRIYLAGNNYSWSMICYIWFIRYVWPRVMYFCLVKMVYYIFIYLPILLFALSIYKETIKFK